MGFIPQNLNFVMLQKAPLTSVGTGGGEWSCCAAEVPCLNFFWEKEGYMDMDACRHPPSQYHLTYIHFWTLNIYKVPHQLMLQVSRTVEWVTALAYLHVIY